MLRQSLDPSPDWKPVLPDHVGLQAVTWQPAKVVVVAMACDDSSKMLERKGNL